MLSDFKSKKVYFKVKLGGIYPKMQGHITHVYI